KSTNNSEIVPETWLPTCTVVTAWSVPVADTVLRMEPRSIFAVMNSSDVARRPHRIYPPVPPTRTTPIAVKMSCFLLSLSFIFMVLSLYPYGDQDLYPYLYLYLYLYLCPSSVPNIKPGVKS